MPEPLHQSHAGRPESLRQSHDGVWELWRGGGRRASCALCGLCRRNSGGAEQRQRRARRRRLQPSGAAKARGHEPQPMLQVPLEKLQGALWARPRPEAPAPAWGSRILRLGPSPWERVRG